MATYEDALLKVQLAQEELAAALHEMHKEGQYPSPAKALRHHLPDERPRGGTCKFQIGFGEEGIEGYFTCNTFTDGKPGELFIVVDKEGSFVSGLLDTIATLISIALQSGVPLKTIISKFRHTRFGPEGMVIHPEGHEIKTASSVVDFIMHWMELKYTDQIGEKK